jgi:phytoene dehydrogenase-like protein
VSGPVIIGAGHNGLAAAYYLARAGLTPIVLEARDTVGGGAITSEMHPGFRCPTLTHYTCLHADIVRDMKLAEHGVTFFSPAVDVFAPASEGAAMIAGATLECGSTKDQAVYRDFRTTITQVAGALAPLLEAPPPDIDDPGAADLWNLLRTGRAVRGLGTRNAYRLLRWPPMPIADLVSEWFDTESVRAALAAPGLSGTMLGPRSAGSGLVFLLRHACDLAAAATRVRGGPGALTAAMAAAARAAGADIRTDARVERILLSNNTVAGVVADGRELPASTVVSAIDPKTTFLQLIAAPDLMPDFRQKVQNYRASGTVAKINLALSALPRFNGDGGSIEVLSGRIHIGHSLDVMERAFDASKYGELPERPWLDVTIPSVLDPDLAPGGAHVMSIYAHYTPFRLRHTEWANAEGDLLARVLEVLETVSPGIGSLVVAAQLLSPAALAAEYGLWGGHIFHGELALDQLFVARPVLGSARYNSPVAGLFLCGAGTHPGGLMTGISGKLAARQVIGAIRG